MPNPRRLTFCLSIALAGVATGCGSSETASTTSKTASATATTSASPNEPAQTTSQGTTPKAPQGATTGPAQKAPQAKPKPPAPASSTSPNAAKPKTKGHEAAPIGEAPKYLYPKSEQHTWIVTCTAAGGSTSSCECILAKYEARNVPEEGESLSELLGVEVALKFHAVLTARAQKYVKECHSAV